MEEFKLTIELCGDENNFGLLTISDNRSQSWNRMPTENIPLENATPEAIGKCIVEYLNKNCV